MEVRRPGDIGPYVAAIKVIVCLSGISITQLAGRPQPEVSMTTGCASVVVMHEFLINFDAPVI
jgi:hypothetical protein